MLESPVLRRTGHVVVEKPTARALIEAVAGSGARLVVVGSRLPDMPLLEFLRRLRAAPATRHVSVLALVTNSDPEDTERLAMAAGANAVLRRPLDAARLDLWMAKLLSVPRRVEARIHVQGQVVGTPRGGGGHFFGLSRNLSVNGMLLASPTPLANRPEVELEFTLPESGSLMRALGRVVRDAPEVSWPYLGYGVEFVFVPPDSLEAIARLVTGRLFEARHFPTIHSTVRREGWVYEILEPSPHSAGWQSEIRRAPRDEWRPGRSGPFYVVEGHSREETLTEALAFVYRHG
jgi:two-component system cell cycle response regulator DivK